MGPKKRKIPVQEGAAKKAKPEPQLMTELHTEIIKRNFDKLTKILSVGTYMLNTFVSESIICDDEQEKIMACTPGSAKVVEFLRMILKKEDRAFYVLINTCKQRAMLHVASLLETEDSQKNTGTEKEDDGEEEDDETDYIVVSYHDKECEVELEEDKTLLMSNLGQIVPSGFTVKGLQYKNPSTERIKLVRLVDEKFTPPKQGWGETVYTVLADPCPVPQAQFSNDPPTPVEISNNSGSGKILKESTTVTPAFATTPESEVATSMPIPVVAATSTMKVGALATVQEQAQLFSGSTYETRKYFNLGNGKFLRVVEGKYSSLPSIELKEWDHANGTHQTVSGIRLNLGRWKKLIDSVSFLSETFSDIREGDDAAVFTKHLGGHIFATAEHPYKCINIRTFFIDGKRCSGVPSSFKDFNGIIDQGISLKRKEWAKFCKAIPEVANAVPELENINLCTHQNIAERLACNECEWEQFETKQPQRI